MKREAALISWGGLLLAGALMLTACGGGGSSGGGGGGGGDGGGSNESLIDAIANKLMSPIGTEAAPSSCTAIGLSSYAGSPGDIITVTGVPNDFEQPFFRSLIVFDAALAPLPGPIPIFSTDTAGEYTFAIPSYVLDPMSGGQVSLELSDSLAERHCPGIDFSIEELPETVASAEDARASLEQLQTALEDWTNKALENIGKNPADLLSADVDTLSKVDQLLWLSKRYVSSSDEGAFSDLLSQLTDENAIFLANSLAAAQTRERLEGASVALPALPSDLVPTSRQTTVLPSARAMTPGNAALQRAATIASRLSVPHISCEVATMEFKYDISTVEQLSEHMRSRSQGSPFDASSMGQLLGVMGWNQKIDSHILGILKNKHKKGTELFDSLSQQEIQVDKLGKAMGAASDINFVVERIQQAMLAMEPHEISSFELTDVEDNWIEDRPAADTMTWGGAQISAIGKDYNLYRVLLDSTKQFGGKWVAKILGGEKGEGFYDIATELSSGYIDEKFKELSKDQCFRLQAPTYGPIIFEDATAKWTQTRVRDGSENVQVIDEKNYQGSSIGNALLEVTPRIEEFPSESGLNLSGWIDVSVEEVRVVADPGYRAVNSTPETFADITATAVAYDANAGTLIAATPNKGTINSEMSSGDTLILNYTTPANLSELPATITYEWSGMTLPSGRDSLREATVKFDKKGHIALSPTSACLTPGEELTITASIDGFPSGDAIAWTGGALTEGSSNLEQVFTADSLGKYTITAFSIDDANIFDETEITVASSCIAKAWSPFVHLELNGSGTFSGGGEGCPSASDPDNISREVTNDGFPEPPLQGAAWVDKDETYSWPSLHSSTRYSFHEGACFSGHLDGRNNSSATYSAKSDGTLALSVDIDMAGDVKKLGTSDNYTMEKVDASFAAVMAGYYYIPVTADTQLHLEGSITCDRVVDNKIMLTTDASVMIVPYDDAGQPLMGWMPGGVTSADFPFVIKDITCQGNEMNFFDKTISISAFNGERPSKVVLFVSGGLLATPYPVDLISPAPLAPGSYETQGAVDFEIRVSEE